MTDDIRLAALMQIAAESFETIPAEEPEPVAPETADRSGMFSPDQQAMIIKLFDFIPDRL